MLFQLSVLPAEESEKADTAHSSGLIGQLKKINYEVIQQRSDLPS
jgi:hypothetical protein